MPKAAATGIVGAHSGLVYLATVLGGLVVMCGHIALAFVPGLSIRLARSSFGVCQGRPRRSP